MSTKKSKLTVSHKLAHAKDGDVISQAQTVLAAMLAAVTIFANPPVALDLFKQHLDSLIASYTAALAGSKKDIAMRNNDRDTVELDIQLLGAYAVKVAAGDPAVLVQSGFQAAPPRTRKKPQPLEAAVILSVEQGNASQLIIFLKALAGAYSYEVRRVALANGVPAGEWTSVAAPTANTPLSINGLTAGTIYAFQVRALGKLGFTDWSDSTTRMCI